MDKVKCKVCELEADPARFCDHCGDGPFCNFCQILRHGLPCGRKSIWRRVLEFIGLERDDSASYVSVESMRRLRAGTGG